jgi:hypothetical protein
MNVVRPAFSPLFSEGDCSPEISANHSNRSRNACVIDVTNDISTLHRRQVKKASKTTKPGGRNFYLLSSPEFIPKWSSQPTDQFVFIAPTTLRRV